MVTKNKLAIPVFVDEEGIPMVHQDEDDDDYEMPKQGRDIIYIIDIISDTTEPTSTLRLIDLGRFRLRKDSKKGATIFEFNNGGRWVPLTKQVSFLPKNLKR